MANEQGRRGKDWVTVGDLVRALTRAKEIQEGVLNVLLAQPQDQRMVMPPPEERSRWSPVVDSGDTCACDR